ncbi:class I SAM-dependent methyltransferase [Desulfotruncus alcoholivorax]|uniref:class I SAM-dependent methyltransferase n=1 Tax=Desulfotruncus alcoholivorax TaxID=265477 RepID=UPI0006850074|nr:class I SAM-dependent methyltransferase [Desulfotruncus alcoholivorax]
MVVQQNDNYIRTHSCFNCYLCGNRGQPLYHGLKDRLFDAPGEWHFRKCSNHKCGLVWLDPMPISEDIGKAYKNYYTHQNSKNSMTWYRRVYQWAKEGYLARRFNYYGNSTTIWKKLLGMMLYFHPGRRENLEFSVMYLPSQPNGLLLDVGCGSGQKLMFMRDLGWLAEGVDIDPIAVDSARSKGLQVRLGTLEEQCYQDNYFDAIILSHLIEHVYDPLGLLLECYRILKPGGRLVVVTPNNESWMHKMFNDKWLALDPPRHLHVFSVPSLKYLAQKAGFKKYKISTTIREANGLFMASKLIQRTGKYVWGCPLSSTFRFWARGMQLAEWVILKFKPDAGEEITMVGEK